jgi:hypothetical protein
MSKKLKKELEKIADINEKTKEKMVTKIFKEEWTNYNLPNPFTIVHQFIKDKGLKLYGGLALHSHLNKHKAGLYESYQFPDYDVLSPDAWNHAQELADILHQTGYMFVEARQSVLNDYHHRTFKVSVDMLYLLDITQRGCTPEQLKEKDCRTCGRDTNGNCMKLFDDLPAYSLDYNIKSNNPTIYRKTYNYNTGKSLYPDKFFVMSPDWLKAQMHRELTEPLSNPSRLPKIGTRLKKFQSFYDFKLRKCSDDMYNKIVKEEVLPYLETIAIFIKNKKLINFGATAHNFFIKDSSNKSSKSSKSDNKNIGNLAVSDYKVYSMNPDYHNLELLKVLRNKYPEAEFISYKRSVLWREHEDLETIIAVKLNNKVDNLITITQHDNCMPYIQYNGIRYATIDRLKYLYYEALSIPTFHKEVENDPLNYECLLSNLIRAEKKFKKNNKTKKKTKFRRYVSKCQGEEYSKIVGNLVDRWIDKTKTLKETMYKPHQPREGWITKISKMPNKELFLPYKPEEEEIKKKVFQNL